MTRLILVRHGETLWNSELVYRGRSEIDLSARGRLQAECLGVRLAQEDVTAIYTSSLSRARQTADAIGRATGTAVVDEPKLMDLDCGEWEGLSVEEVKRRYPELSRLWQASPHLVRLPGGESLDDVAQRVAPLLDDVLKREGVVVLVSHRVVHKVAICALLGLGNSATWQIQMDTAGVTVFDCAAGRNVLMLHNDTSHLSEECRS
ncbi:MAG: histidine phosphatase family protein [Dehalococcoidia bacterium]|nr:histidine phosphatase family protein [Dehalococcoidia bacterium]